MIIKLFCPKCAHDISKNLVDYAAIDVPVPVTKLSDNGIHEIICGQGHRSFVAVHNLKFELLFEMGLNSLVDGNYKDAVSSFVASLERFYEFYWRVAMAHLNVLQENISAAWKPLSKQSERQLGAYISASLIINKKPPNLLTSKEVEFRNDVIHKGYIPKQDEAIKFGEAVKDLINNELASLQTFCSESLKTTHNSLLPKIPKEIEEKLDKDEIVGGANIITTIDALNPYQEGDTRTGNLTDQFTRVLREREPTQMLAFKGDKEREEYMAKHKSTPTSNQALPFAGNNYALLTAPLGWVIEPGQQPGPTLAWLYKAGINLNTAIHKQGEFMYINFWDRLKNNESLEQLINLQENNILEVHKDAIFQYQDTIQRKDAKTKLRILRYSKNDLPEYTGFIEFDDFIFFCVLICPAGSESINLTKLESILMSLEPGKVVN